ncbi:MAG: hypothetical protein KBG28_16635 [Kofleriaceae bacterium]|jgi:hypothetical protein|nr:hypothetical protein [Kofleriaceae bacterium]MBP6839251.1 hypothetical protein [Kofleriaceae bacterium]MBP9205600.1 hypothetical protein [Kofleriaceae bacterium]
MGGSDAGLIVVGTIRSLILHTLGSRFEGVPKREVARLELDVERATHGDGTDIEVGNLAGVSFQGPPELVPAYALGERVQLTVSSEMHIASIRRAPLS